MATLTLENISDPLLYRLKERASELGRDLQQEAAVCLKTGALRASDQTKPTLTLAAALRKRVQGVLDARTLERLLEQGRP